MTTFLEVDHIDRIFKLPNGSKYIALKNIELKIKQGEFISLIGHSGCGKSTLLNIIAGLDRASVGGVILEGREVREPGPDRMVVFQNYSLLPWLTVRENIALAVDEVYQNHPKGLRREIVEENIEIVGLRHAANKRPSELSGGMKQRVAIARALATRPKLLLLDEPFGALDALTRGSLQAQLMKICNEHNVTCVMVTHDVDEALLLSDRIVMLTNGPEAHIGQILEVPIPRPRQRLEVVNHPSYYNLRNEMIYFLNQQKQAKKRQSKVTAPTIITRNNLEKTNLEIGFVPLTDAAPLIVAKEKGFFAEYGLNVNLSWEPSWNEIARGIATGRLDAAQMVAGMPLAMTLGADNDNPVPVVTPMILSRNGNAITFSKQLFNAGVKDLAQFQNAISVESDRTPILGVVHSASMQNLLLRYWLAAGGIHPDRDVSLIEIAPPQMVISLRNQLIDGYCVGEPWNSRAVAEELGFVIATTGEIWSEHPEKVLGVREDWAQQNPQTHIALVKALLMACEYCDDLRNREEIFQLISHPNYLGNDSPHLRPGFIDPYQRGDGTKPKLLTKFNQFYLHKANYPNRDEMLWILTQMARWGLVAFPKNWVEVIDRVCRTDVFGLAARELSLLDMGREAPIQLFDGKEFNSSEPIKYLQNLKIKRQLRVEEVFI
ncbi:MAG TPA: nitrate ABC transporter ATP-binding protein [Nostocaceae cyanobacterium]|nr:nitrate ABC transporter ATP-binding protein [Nostocaceae cyanobacterium]